MLPGLTLLALAIVIGGAFATRLARWSITLPMLFVATGLILGPAVTGLLPIQPEAELVHALTEMALALLLFADAATLSLRQVEIDRGLPLRLLLIGLPLTLILGVLVAKLALPGFTWAFAALLGAILAPTDAALGLPIFQDPRVPMRIRRALNVESGLNDGMATPFVALALAFALAETEATEHWLPSALLALAIGVAVGALVGAGGARLLALAKARAWTSPASLGLAGLGLAAAAFFGAQALGGNGFIAAFVGGIALAGRGHHRLDEASELTEMTGTLLSILVWVLFGALMLPLAARATGDWRPIVYAVLSLTLIRMLPVALALVGAGLRRDTVALMGWFGPRGLASVVFTLLAFVELEAAGKLDATLIATATWTILFSVLFHGISATPLAKRYAQRLAAADGPLEELRDLPELPGRRPVLAEWVGGAANNAPGDTGAAQAGPPRP